MKFTEEYVKTNYPIGARIKYARANLDRSYGFATVKGYGTYDKGWYINVCWDKYPNNQMGHEVSDFCPAIPLTPLQKDVSDYIAAEFRELGL